MAATPRRPTPCGYIAPSVPSPKMSSRLLPHAATAGGLVKTPPSRSQSSGDGRHAAPSHALWIHRAVGAEPEDVEPVLTPRRDPIGIRSSHRRGRVQHGLERRRRRDHRGDALTEVAAGPLRIAAAVGVNADEPSVARAQDARSGIAAQRVDVVVGDQVALNRRGGPASICFRWPAGCPMMQIMSPTAASVAESCV